MIKRRQILTIILSVLFFGPLAVGLGVRPQADTRAWSQGLAAQAVPGTSFTYQGYLTDDGSSVNATCDLQFGLYDAASSGTQIGSTQSSSSVGVSDGLFTVQLNFGSSAFSGDARWLEIAVRCPTGGGSYSTLTPRQALTAAPYALALPGLWTQQNSTSPNLIGGYSGNRVAEGIVGATIGGGGSNGHINWVTADYATVGGGEENVITGAQSRAATIGGGEYINVTGQAATVAGGSYITATGDYVAVGGGWTNIASGERSTIGGGTFNTASGYKATVGGAGPTSPQVIMPLWAGAGATPPVAREPLSAEVETTPPAARRLLSQAGLGPPPRITVKWLMPVVTLAPQEMPKHPCTCCTTSPPMLPQPRCSWMEALIA